MYVIGMEEDATAVKIGFATDVDDRRSMLQTSSHRTLKVLAFIKGTPAKEKELHRKFAADHIRGEWFRKTQAPARRAHASPELHHRRDRAPRRQPS
ncbi:GIY-YIG nuclease family protein [Bradyrhizobium elkanii]|uniref:GIY-YIG nuclease family protein n=1 Tax=Bradyrhizobium elkanii TaxID=29448 RepID=A0A4U6RI49_BRAEL|nr:GIY-YIG nuclease family protein [Bradyrhizobium elkanii]TKV73681.1 GIY-YIG nuclease family protein [Bradyrhizobium elkanii]